MLLQEPHTMLSLAREGCSEVMCKRNDERESWKWLERKLLLMAQRLAVAAKRRVDRTVGIS